MHATPADRASSRTSDAAFPVNFFYRVFSPRQLAALQRAVATTLTKRQQRRGGTQFSFGRFARSRYRDRKSEESTSRVSRVCAHFANTHRRVIGRYRASARREEEISLSLTRLLHNRRIGFSRPDVCRFVSRAFSRWPFAAGILSRLRWRGRLPASSPMIRTCARRYSLLRLRACVRPERVQ